MAYKIKNSATQSMTESNYQLFGDIIDPSWARHIKRKSNDGVERTHFQAMLILAKIVYMYRPVKESSNIGDKATGQGSFQKFSTDMWQCSRKALADYYGMTTKEVDNALTTLIDMGVITKESRTIVVNSQRISNALHIGLNYPKLLEISTPINRTSDSYSCLETELLPEPTIALNHQRDTYTKTSRKVPLNERTTTTKTDNSSSSATPKNEYVKTNQETSSFCIPHPRLFELTWNGFENILSEVATQYPDFDVYKLADWIDFQHFTQSNKAGQTREPMGLLRCHLVGKINLNMIRGYSPTWREDRDFRTGAGRSALIHNSPRSPTKSERPVVYPYLDQWLKQSSEERSAATEQLLAANPVLEFSKYDDGILSSEWARIFLRLDQ